MDAIEMSPAAREALAKARRLVPPMLEHFHKGQMGRVAVIGGSEDYTGAPYFSAMASARLGCDLSHVICTPAAAAVIKTYSPNLMVHPLMRESAAATAAGETPSGVAAHIIAMLPRLHVLVIGPGLGRDAFMQDTVAHVIRAARERCLGLVLDADALLAVGRQPSLVRGYRFAVLTPNVVEFARLGEALGVDVHGGGGGGGEDGARALARALGGPVVVRKGAVDVVCDAEGVCVGVDAQGGRKRSGGQGDTLTGTIATLLAWRKGYAEGLWGNKDEKRKMSEDETMVAAAVGGCVITRECSRRAFAKRGRSMQASDLTEEVHAAFLGVFPGVEGEEE